jgi:hypothetical protein
MPRPLRTINVEYRELVTDTGEISVWDARIAFDPTQSVGTLRDSIAKRRGWEMFKLAARKKATGLGYFLDDNDAVEEVLFKNESVLDSTTGASTRN